jgi:2-polyprenyl-3-methyl-5-hydroxy-6-metoxy-1,4-benzoquinol methylase
MSDAVKWHSENARKFDLKYMSSRTFMERLAVWNSFINTYVKSDFEVLDAGCGSGVITALAARRAHRVFGFDGSPEMVALAEARRQKERLDNITLRVAALEDVLSLSSSRFDLILCSSVLEYVEDYWLAIERLSTVLVPGGILIFSMPNGASLYRKVEGAFYRLTGRPAYYAHVRHVPLVNQVCTGLLTRSMETLEVKYYASVPAFSTVAQAVGRSILADNLFAVVCRSKA